MITNVNRRVALDALASVPALAILPPFPPTELVDLIVAHRKTSAAFGAAVATLEAAEPDSGVRLSFLGRELCAIGDSDPGRLIEEMEIIFQHELEKLSTISRLSPELGEAARGRLETGKADCLAQVEEVFADHRGAEQAYDDALDAEDNALLALCSHRCTSIEEIAVKVRYLASLGCDLEPRQRDAFFWSILRGADLPSSPERRPARMYGGAFSFGGALSGL